MHIKFPLGKTFGRAHDISLQKNILIDLLEFSITGDPESIVDLPYSWRNKN